LLLAWRSSVLPQQGQVSEFIFLSPFLKAAAFSQLVTVEGCYGLEQNVLLYGKAVFSNLAVSGLASVNHRGNIKKLFYLMTTALPS
jgi:hypothetical protein